MPLPHPLSRLTGLRRETLVASAIALALAVGWASREIAHAADETSAHSQTVTLSQVAMSEFRDKDQPVGALGVYVSGETPKSSKFVTGRFVLDAGKTPHAPHTHVEEEVMVVESGHGEIFCDGKTTKVGPGSVMYTTPNAPHGITNTGSMPLVFYFIKWAAKDSH